MLLSLCQRKKTNTYKQLIYDGPEFSYPFRFFFNSLLQYLHFPSTLFIFIIFQVTIIIFFTSLHCFSRSTWFRYFIIVPQHFFYFSWAFLLLFCLNFIIPCGNFLRPSGNFLLFMILFYIYFFLLIFFIKGRIRCWDILKGLCFTLWPTFKQEVVRECRFIWQVYPKHTNYPPIHKQKQLQKLLPSYADSRFSECDTYEFFANKNQDEKQRSVITIFSKNISKVTPSKFLDY